MAPIIHDTPIQKDDEPSIHPSNTTTCNPVKSKISNIELPSTNKNIACPSNPVKSKISNVLLPSLSQKIHHKKVQSNKSKPTKTPIRSSKRLQQINKNKKLPSPKALKVVENAIKPEVPLHIGIALNSPFQSEWIEATFGGYNKMH